MASDPAEYNAERCAVRPAAQPQSESLLLAQGERPASVFWRGGEVQIHTHDAWHTRTKQLFVADIQALHPDSYRNFNYRRRAHRAGRACARAIAAYKAWLRKEE